jgi:hypothetical protein
VFDIVDPDLILDMRELFLGIDWGKGHDGDSSLELVGTFAPDMKCTSVWSYMYKREEVESHEEP